MLESCLVVVTKKRDRMLSRMIKTAECVRPNAWTVGWRCQAKPFAVGLSHVGIMKGTQTNQEAKLGTFLRRKQDPGDDSYCFRAVGADFLSSLAYLVVLLAHERLCLLACNCIWQIVYIRQRFVKG
ncbi:hypothetical protein Droror1_Dr00000371 [Drosera rotundifolia]